MNKILKILVISILIFFIAVFSGFSWLYYSGRINTYQPITIKNANNEAVNFKAYGVTPFGRVFPFIQRDSFNVSCYYAYCRRIEVQFQAGSKTSKHDIVIKIGSKRYIYHISSNNRFIKPDENRGNISYWGTLISVFHWHISKILLNIFFITTIILLLLFNKKRIYLSIKQLLKKLYQLRKLLIINLKSDIIIINNTNQKVSELAGLQKQNIQLYILKAYNNISKLLQFTNNTIPYTTLSIIFSILVIFPFLYLSFFTFPTPEEIQTGADTYDFGLKYIGFIYHIMNGRFFTNFLYAISPLTWHSILGYQMTNFIIIISLCVSSYFFISSVFKGIIPKKKILEYSLLLIVLFNCLMPGIAAGYYWLIAVLAYMVALVFLLILLSLLIRNGNKMMTVCKAVIIGILVLIICFSVEMYLPIIASLLFILIVITFYYKRNNKWYYLGFFMLTIIAALIIFSAPGHTIRIAPSHASGTKITDLFSISNLVQALNFSFQSLLESFHRYVVKTPVILIFSILSVPVFYKIKLGTGWLKKIVRINPLWSGLGFLLLMILPVLPYYIVAMNGNLYLDRLFNIICFLFILAWFYNLFVIIVFIKKYKIIQCLFEINKNRVSIILLKWAVILFFIAFVFYPKSNIYLAYSDIFSGRAANYRRQLECRFEKMNRPLKNIYPGHSLLVVDSLSFKPRSIHFQDYDVTGFENNFRERIADYFHVNEVRYCTDTIPYHRPLFMSKSIFTPDDFKNISISSSSPVFENGLLPSFLCGLYGTDTISGKWFLYKDFNFGYNMYDSTLMIHTRLWIEGNSAGYLPVINMKYTNVKGDTIFAELTDTLKPKILETSGFIVYDKIKLNLIEDRDKRFLDALLDDSIRFVLKSRIIHI